eukprot:811765_1
MFAPLKIHPASSILQRKLPSPIIHFKGFGRYINFKNSKTKKLRSDCIETICALLENGGSLIWDGDSYNNDSFTFIIPLLFDELFKIRNMHKNEENNALTNKQKQWLFLAFIKETDVSRFIHSWSNKLRISKYNKNLCINFELKPLTQIQNFIELGIEAINITKSQIVICFGGGYVVQHEYNTLTAQYLSKQNSKNTE